MEFKFVTLTPDNLASEHLSCIIRTKKHIREWKPNAGGWLSGFRRAIFSANWTQKKKKQPSLNTRR